MLPAPAPGEGPKDPKIHSQAHGRHADAATGVNLAPWSGGAVPVAAAQQMMVLQSVLRLFPTRYLRDRVASMAAPGAVPAHPGARGEGRWAPAWVC